MEKSFIIAKFVNYNELINNNMEEAKGQSILDKMLTTFINTLVKAAENEAQTHFGKNLEEVSVSYTHLTLCLACGKREAVSWPTEGNH